MKKTKELGFRASLSILNGRKARGSFSGGRAEALAEFLGVDAGDISPYGGNPNENRYVTPEGTYLVLNYNESIDEAEEGILKEFRETGLNSYFETRVRDAIIDGLDRDALRSIVDERMYHQVENGELPEEEFESKLDRVTSANDDAVDFLENEYGMSDSDLAEDLLSGGAIDPHTLASIVVEEIGAGGYLASDGYEESSPDSELFFYKLED